MAGIVRVRAQSQQKIALEERGGSGGGNGADKVTGGDGSEGPANLPPINLTVSQMATEVWILP